MGRRLQRLGARVGAHSRWPVRARRFRALVEGVDAILWEADAATFRISFVSRSAERLLGYPRERWLSERNFWEEHLDPNERERVVAEALAHIQAGEHYEIQYPVIAADGRAVWLRDIVRVSCNRLGAADRIIGISVDITERKKIERSLLESEARKRAILDAALDCVITIDHEGRVVDFNPAAERTFGYSLAEVAGQPMAELIVPPRLREAHDRGFRHYLATGEGPVLGKRLELPAMRADGSEFPIEIAIVRVELPGPPVFTAYVRDITDRKEAEAIQKQTEEALREQALHDSLTGLPNRTLFHDRVLQGIRVARREGTHLAVVILDLDRFKEINDTLGHQSGDRVLQTIGKRLLATLRDSDTVARLGGDEFGVVFPVASRADAIETITRMQRVFGRPFTLSGVPLQVEASAGLALFPEHGTDGELLLQRADVAMYVAKVSDSDLSVYDPSNDTYEPRRLALGAELRRAIDRHEFVVYYQPQADMETDVVTGVEALVRWQHPTRGLLPPDEFIPFAEPTGLMKPITLYVLDEALGQCKVWLDEGRTLRLSVNISMRNLLDPTFPDAVELLLEKWRIPAAQLALEITERTLARDPFRVKAVLDRLSELGVRLSVDDYGTGYSALGNLRRLPLHELKIDRSFVMAMTTDGNDATIVRTTIDLAQNLGLEVVAEGVETQETYDLLRTLNCNFAQGFLLSRPLPANELTAWLDRTGPIIGANPPLAAGRVSRRKQGERVQSDSRSDSRAAAG